jgi:anti-sigma factor RsiW
MDCAKSLALLSEFRDGALDEEYRAMVRAHLALCPPCEDVFQDLDTIVAAAALMLRAEKEISFPDENLLWQRMALTGRTIH